MVSTDPSASRFPVSRYTGTYLPVRLGLVAAEVDEELLERAKGCDLLLDHFHPLEVPALHELVPQHPRPLDRVARQEARSGRPARRGDAAGQRTTRARRKRGKFGWKRVSTCARLVTAAIGAQKVQGKNNKRATPYQ